MTKSRQRRRQAPLPAAPRPKKSADARRAYAAQTVPSRRQLADVPSVDALLARMIDAAGGEAALRAHTSVEIHAHKSYDNQGVFAD